MRRIIVAIDGHSACGKSTTARNVARELGYAYIDTGAMYRAVTYYFINHHVALTNPREVREALNNIKIHFEPVGGKNCTFLNGLNIENQIRSMDVSNMVSEVSAIAEVRKEMVNQQRMMGRRKGVVMDGRDIGTVVFPDAELKIFMTADMDIRAERRQRELLDKGELLDLDEIRENLEKRDYLDAHRDESPLKQAEDAVVVDTSGMTLEEQVERVVGLAREKIMENA